MNPVNPDLLLTSDLALEKHIFFFLPEIIRQLDKCMKYVYIVRGMFSSSQTRSAAPCESQPLYEAHFQLCLHSNNILLVREISKGTEFLF